MLPPLARQTIEQPTSNSAKKQDEQLGIPVLSCFRCCIPIPNVSGTWSARWGSENHLPPLVPNAGGTWRTRLPRHAGTGMD